MPVHGAAEPKVERDRKRSDYVEVLRAFAEKNKIKRKFIVDGRTVTVHPTGADKSVLVVELPRPAGVRRSRAAEISLRYMYPGGFTASFTGFVYGVQQKWVEIANAEFKDGTTATGLLLGVLGAVLTTADSLEALYTQAAAEPELRTRARIEQVFKMLHKALATPKVVVVGNIPVTASQAKTQRGFSDVSDIKLEFIHSVTKKFLAAVEVGMFDVPDLYVHIRGRKPVPYEDYPLSAPELLRFVCTKFVEQVYGPGYIRKHTAQAATEPELTGSGSARSVRIYEKLRAGLPAEGKQITYKNNTFRLYASASASVPGNKYILVMVSNHRMRFNVTGEYGPSLRNERDGWRGPPGFSEAVDRARTPEVFLRVVLDAVLWAVLGHDFNYAEAAAEPEEYAGAEKRWIKAVRALPKDGIHARLLGKETSVTPERNHLGEMGVGFDFYYNDVKYRVAVLSSGARLRIHSHHPVLYVRKPELEIPAGHGADLLRAVMLVVARKLSLPGAVTAAAEPVVSIHDRLLKLHAALENKPKAVFKTGEDRQISVDTGLPLSVDPNRHINVNYETGDGSSLGYVTFFCFPRSPTYRDLNRVHGYFTQGGIRHDRREFTVSNAELRRLHDTQSTLKFLISKAASMLIPKPVHRPVAAAEPPAGFETVFHRTWELLDNRPSDLRVDLNGLEIVLHAGRDFSNKPNIFVNVCRGSVDLEMFTFAYVIGFGLRYTQGHSRWETCKTLQGKLVREIQTPKAFLSGLVNLTHTLTEAKASR